MASGDTKTEALLNILGHGGTGNEYRGSGNTKTQNYILDAIDRINALDPGSGGGAFKALSASDVTGKDPDDNDIIELWKLPTGTYTFDIGEDDSYYIVANTSYDEGTDTYSPDWTFVGTGIINITSTDSDRPYYAIFYSDGVVSFYAVDESGLVNFNDINASNVTFSGADSSIDGESGLVPAPTTSDAGKFLCADGTWQDAGTKVVDLTITGVSGNQVTATASEYLDDITNSGNVESYAFRIYVPEGGALPFVGNMIFRVDMYNVGESLFCYKTLYDYTNNITYHLVMWFVTVNGNMHSNNVLIQIFPV